MAAQVFATSESSPQQYCQLSGVVATEQHVFVSDFDQDLVHVFEIL